MPNHEVGPGVATLAQEANSIIGLRWEMEYKIYNKLIVTYYKLQ